MNFSATMLDTAKCMRRAAFKYASDYPGEPKDESRSLGQQLHDAEEAYSKRGVVPPEDTEVGQLFRAGLPWIAPPGRGLVEAKQELVLAGFRYTIKIDWQGTIQDLSMGVGEDFPSTLPAILDFKTSKRPLVYGIGLTPDKPPLGDNQVILYSAYALVHNRSQSVFVRWLYLKTGVKKKKAYPSDFWLTRSQIEDSISERVIPTSSLLKKVLEERPHPNDVEPDIKWCDEYRGCHYAEITGGPCRLSNEQKLKGLSETMGILDTLGQNNQQPQQQVQAPAQTQLTLPLQAVQGEGLPPVPSVAVQTAPVQTQTQAVNPSASAAPPANVARINQANRQSVAERLGFAILDVIDYTVALIKTR